MLSIGDIIWIQKPKSVEGKKTGKDSMQTASKRQMEFLHYII